MLSSNRAVWFLPGSPVCICNDREWVVALTRLFMALAMKENKHISDRRQFLRNLGLAASAGATGALATSLGAPSPASAAGVFPYLNVKDYGAVGNGSSDETAAFNVALTAAGNAGGGKVIAPHGGVSV